MARGSWRAQQNRLDDAVNDLAAAVNALNDTGDRLTRGRARQLLCHLRNEDTTTFDQAWSLTDTPLPTWLKYQVMDEELAHNIIEWVNTPDWSASKTYLDEHAATFLTDNAEAVLQHLIDYNPYAETLQDHLDLLQSIRTEGSDAAYAAYQEQLLANDLSQTLQKWINTPTWTASQAFAAEHGEELLHPTSIAILNDLSDQNPGDYMLRLHCGLLAYATEAGFDTAYELRADTDSLRNALAASDPSSPGGSRLALARLHSGQSPDDPEAHFQLAVIAMLLGNVREAAAALTDCADNAAPYERRDFAHRLSQLSNEDSQLAVLTSELQNILDTRLHTDSGGSVNLLKSPCFSLTRTGTGRKSMFTAHVRECIEAPFGRDGCRAPL